MASMGARAPGTTWSFSMRKNPALWMAVVFFWAAAAPAAELPGRYFRLMEAELAPIDKRLEAERQIDLKALEAGQKERHFPGAILAAAVLYTKEHPANPSFGDKKKLALALRIGDLLADENEKGAFQARLDHDWDLYMWLEA